MSMGRRTISVLTLCWLFLDKDAAQAQAPDTLGGIASTRVIVRLRADAFARSNLRRAGAAAEADALPQTSARLQAVAASWRASRMRRAYENAFANPALAEKHGLDRTYILEVPAGTDTERLARALSAVNDEIEFASPDVIGGVASGPLIPTDPFFGDQWAMHNTGQSIQGGPSGTTDADIDAPEAWAIHTGVGPNQVIVAVIDSGISSHPEFGNNLGLSSTGRVLPGYNTVVASNPQSAANLQDTCQHGTHVAGVIGAAGGTSCGGGTADTGKTCDTVADCALGCLGGSNVGQLCVNDGDCPGSVCGSPTCSAIGVAGVSWGVYLLPVKVLTGCSGFAGDLSEGIVWAADNGADIINISLQFNLTQQASITTLQSAVNYAHDNGVLLAGATGNNDACGNGAPPNDTVCYPARLSNVMAVSATDNHDVLGTFSNYGAEVDVAAPGKDVISTGNNGNYFYLSMSFATAHVSGLAALLKSYVPSLTNDQIEEIIITSAEDRGDPGWDSRYGHGRINAANALTATCANNSECDDGNDCTDDLCLGVCESSNNSAACDDSLYCTILDTCNEGNCLGAPRDCDDGLRCTTDACDEQNDRCMSQDSGLCGACCDHDTGTCANQTFASECLCDECEWHAGATCIECERNSIPAASTWGMAILTLLLLIAAKLRFVRHFEFRV